jgi:hypothetical protein
MGTHWHREILFIPALTELPCTATAATTHHDGVQRGTSTGALFPEEPLHALQSSRCSYIEQHPLIDPKKISLPINKTSSAEALRSV